MKYYPDGTVEGTPEELRIWVGYKKDDGHAVDGENEGENEGEDQNSKLPIVATTTLIRSPQPVTLTPWEKFPPSSPPYRVPRVWS